MNEVCYCPASSARDGHIHEEGGDILCLHWYDDETDEYEDGSSCPAQYTNDTLEDNPYITEVQTYMDGDK